MQFSGPPRSISNYVQQHCFAQANGGSTKTTMAAFHALLLPSKHCQIMSDIWIYCRRQLSVWHRENVSPLTFSNYETFN